MPVKLTRLNDLIEDGEPVAGTWELLPGHTLGYRGKERDEEYRVKAPLIAAEPGALVAAATVRQDDQTVITRILKLSGRWRSDDRNRLVFEAERARGRTDQLTLTGAWTLNDTNEIVYTYRSEASAAARAAAKRSARPVRRDRVQQIVFKGAWEITGDRHITYRMQGGSDSGFTFRGAFQTPSTLAKKGEVRFSLGAEISGRSGTKRDTSGRAAGRGPAGVRTITFFGSWKLGRDLSLSFELDRGPASRKQAFRFGAEWAYAKGRTAAVQLTTARGEPIGAELLLTRARMTAWGEAEFFARLERSAAEARAEAGARFRW
jgi:hypothetical protein